MKKITLLVAILLVGSVANASEIIRFSDDSRFSININDAEPIQFTERGIEFFIFPDGQFDFNTVPSQGENYYRKAGRRDFNSTYGAPNYNSGIKIENDSFGRIRRIGNVFINYDFNDRIKRIGSVYMTYNRFALAQVGGLKIVYNRRGQIVDYVGCVKGRANFTENCNYNYNSSTNYNDYNNYQDNTETDGYYYRTAGSNSTADNDKKEEKK